MERSEDLTTETKHLTVTTPSDREILMTREFDAPRDLVWKAFTDPEMLAQWWGRGNKLDIERMDVERGGHWRYVEHHEGGSDGFEGRYGDVAAPERIVQTFEWDGMPAHVALNTTVFEDVGGSRTRLVTTSLFHTQEDRDGMVQSGMEQGLSESYAALERLLASTLGASNR
jgi:uncharacterized protein YndB with AHSA1/START domain